jgi:CHAT domain-containing protein
MPETPDWPPLGGVEDQLDALRGFTPKIEHLNKPSGYRVLEELPKSSIAPFVCHGISNHKNPHSSCLVLYNNMTDRTNALNISDISRLQLNRAKLAYLSACETADSASIKLVDENIQFASMFQTAGYPHVIATLWKAEMRASTKMGKVFYRNLAKGIDKEGEEVIARAFHNAVLEVRAEDPDEPVTWAAFVYFGV